VPLVHGEADSRCYRQEGWLTTNRTPALFALPGISARLPSIQATGSVAKNHRQTKLKQISQSLGTVQLTPEEVEIYSKVPVVCPSLFHIIKLRRAGLQPRRRLLCLPSKPRRSRQVRHPRSRIHKSYSRYPYQSYLRPANKAHTWC